MKKVRLSKISGGNALRTESIVGMETFDPEVGRSYVVLGNPLKPGMDIRQFVTSIVQNVETTENGYILKTLNSVYKVEILNSEDGEDSLAHLPKEG